MLKKTADTILDEPILITVDIKPQSAIHRILQRFGLSQKQVIYPVHGATLRNMIRISKLLLDVDFKAMPDNDSIGWGYDLISSETARMTEIIAIAIHNQRSERPDSLVDLILDNFSATELRAVSGLIIDRLNVADFISSIASVRTMNLLEASPQGPEIIAEPKVISGEQLGGLKNIFDGARIT